MKNPEEMIKLSSHKEVVDALKEILKEQHEDHEKDMAEIIKVYQENEDYFPFDTMPPVRPYIDMWKAIKAVAERFIEKGERN